MALRGFPVTLYERGELTSGTTGRHHGQLHSGARVEVTPCPGTLLVVKGRLTEMVISRLSPPGDGDILVPQRRLSIIGTTEWVTDDPDGSAFRRKDLPFLIRRGTED